MLGICFGIPHTVTTETIFLKEEEGSERGSETEFVGDNIDGDMMFFLSFNCIENRCVKQS